MNIILKESKPHFRRKTRVNKLMIGLTDEVVKDTEKIIKTILQKNQYDVVSFSLVSQEEQPKDDHVDGSALMKEDDVNDKQGDDNVDEDTQNPLDQPMETQDLVVYVTV